MIKIKFIKVFFTKKAPKPFKMKFQQKSEKKPVRTTAELQPKKFFRSKRGVISSAKCLDWVWYLGIPGTEVPGRNCCCCILLLPISI
jgi:hypothetical protein